MICRLCLATADQIYVPIFDELVSDAPNPSQIISKYFQMNLRADDCLSTYICNSCWTQLQDFHKFHLEIDQKQQELLRQSLFILKKEQEVPQTLALDENEAAGTAIDFLFCEPQIDDADVNAFVDEQEFSAAVVASTNSKDCIENNGKFKSTSKQTRPKKQFKDRTKSTVSNEELPNKCLRRLRSGKVEDVNVDNGSSECVQGSSSLRVRRENDAYIAQYAELSCVLCQQPLKDFSDLKSHYRSVHQCVGYVMCCAKRFLERSVFVDHLKLHANPNLFKCKECDKILTSRNCYNNHMVTCHPQELKYECTICTRKFAKQYVLGVHLRKHLDKKVHTCETCHKSYRSLSDMRSHERTVHLNLNEIICDICGKNFRNKQSFKTHRTFVHPDDDIIEMQCKICQRWLKNKRILQMHMRNHREEKSGKQWVCNICGIVKQTRQTLLSHKRYHHSDKIFKCTLCEKEFKRALSLEEHMATHTGKALYQCSFCPQTFKSHANMHNHKKRIHPSLWVRKHTQPSAGSKVK